MPWFFKHRQDPDQRVFPAYEFQSSKNRCRRPSGGSLQPQKEVAPPCPIETPITSNQPFNGNSGVRSESGCRREHKPFGMEGCLMKQQRCTQNSLEGPLWANEDGGVKEADVRALGQKKGGCLDPPRRSNPANASDLVLRNTERTDYPHKSSIRSAMPSAQPTT